MTASIFDPTPCAHCHRPLGQDECADERGAPSGVHADCWPAWCADRASVAEDAAVDRAQEAELWREWGGR